MSRLGDLWRRVRGRGGDATPQRRSSAFAGASSSRLTADWTLAQLQAANQEVRGDLRKLRARSRDLARNDGYGRRFVQLVAENVVGHQGVKLQARIPRLGGGIDEDHNAEIERGFRRWCRPEFASADRRLSWIGIQQLAIRCVAQDGEALIRMLPAFDNPFGFAVQILDPDQLDVDFNRPRGSRGENAIRMGVEIDRFGASVAYWIWTAHPHDWGVDRERVRVPASQIIHLFLIDRPGQLRGIPWFAPVILSQRMLGGYQEAHLVAARIGASKMGFFTRKSEIEPDDTDDAPLSMDASPGSFEELPEGYEFTEWNPEYPAAGYPEFVKAMLRSIATGLGVSYNTLANDLEGVNYSSIRAGLITERDAWRVLQTWLVEQLHERVYGEWLKWALTMGALDLPTRNVDDWSAHTWQPRGWQWVDPLKDGLAAEKAIENLLDSRHRLAAEQGRDFGEILADLRREREMADEAGVPMPTPGANAHTAAMDLALRDESDERGAHLRIAKA